MVWVVDTAAMTRAQALVLAVVCVAAGASPLRWLPVHRRRRQARVPPLTSSARLLVRRGDPSRRVGSVGGVGVFTERCGYSHTANVDPILMPGMTGMSMLHDFFGNAGTDQNSTDATLAGGPSTCATSAGSSAYSTRRSCTRNSGQLRPVRATIYWRARAGVASTGGAHAGRVVDDRGQRAGQLPARPRPGRLDLRIGLRSDHQANSNTAVTVRPGRTCGSRSRSRRVGTAGPSTGLRRRTSSIPAAGVPARPITPSAFLSWCFTWSTRRVPQPH